jgi:hypothetical protein
VLESSGGLGDNRIGLTVQPNTTTTPRNGNVTVAGVVVSVTQAAAASSEEIRIEGPVSQVSGTCPAITFRLSGRSVRTDAATQFVANRCDRVVNGQSVNVRGTAQSDGSLLATRVMVNGGGPDEVGDADALR